MAFAAATIAILMIAGATQAQAQTYSVIHNLSASDGEGLLSGLVADRAGNLYGSASWGGNQNCQSSDPGCGTIFKLTRHGSGWLFSVLYAFTGDSDGSWPENLAFGPDGSLYGTTSWGGISSGCLGFGCGTVFRLQPPARFCSSVNCPWHKTTLYQFANGDDGRYPNGIVVDAAGNVYGTAEGGNGTVWELSPAHGGWTYNTIYTFPGISNGANPLTGVALDGAGNLWGWGAGGFRNCGSPYDQFDCGAIYKLSPSASGWNLTLVYRLNHDSGGVPLGLFTFDAAGNMYGTLSSSGPNGNGGVFQYVPSTGQMSLLYAAPGNEDEDYGPQGAVAMDQAGNLYAADPSNGAYGAGYVFQLMPSNGYWTYNGLHDFMFDNNGSGPYGPLVVDTQGIVYGAAAGGNLIFEVAP